MTKHPKVLIEYGFIGSMQVVDLVDLVDKQDKHKITSHFKRRNTFLRRWRPDLLGREKRRPVLRVVLLT